MRTLAAIMIGLLVLAAGCTSSSGEELGAIIEPTESAPPPAGDNDSAEDRELDEPQVVFTVEDLDATSWTLMFGGGPDGEIPLVDGWPITLTFDSDRFSGTAACNGYGANYKLDGTLFQVTEFGREDAGCAPQVQQSEQAFLKALTDIDGINLVGDELALSGPASELIFRRNAPAQIDDVTATLWLLEELLHDGETTPVAGQPATLQISSRGALGGTLSATTGCRTLTGIYRVTGNEIALTSFGTDGDTICPTSLRDQDSAVVSVLGDSFVPEIEGDLLTVISVGNLGLRYRATTEDHVASLAGVAVQSDAEMLDGIEWIFTGGSNRYGEIPDPRSLGDQSITFMIDGDLFRGVVLCNDYSGRADISNGRWQLNEPFTDQEGCGSTQLQAIAAKYLTALALMDEFGIESGGNRLTTNDGEATELTFERADY